MAKPNGVRFRVDGIAEKALKHLAALPRHKHHHYDLALKDLDRALALVPVRSSVVDEATRNRQLAIGDADVASCNASLAAAKHNLTIAKHAVDVCLSRLRSKTDPKTGKPISHAPGRAPTHVSGPVRLLELEQAARERLTDAEVFLATADMLPELTSPHQRWQRLQFAHYVDSIAHETARHRAMPDAGRHLSDDDVLAFILYVQREASKNGVPLVMSAHGRLVGVEHALWGDRLNEADFQLIANFVIFAAKRLQLTAHWQISRPMLFEIGPPSPNVDYGHVVRRLRQRSWRSPAATDQDLFEDMPEPQPAAAYSTEFAARMAAEKQQRQLEDDAYAKFLETGVPQLGHANNVEAANGITVAHLDSSKLPYSLVRLFRGVKNMRRVPPVSLDKRQPGPAWYAMTGSYIVSADLIAGELAEAISNGDLDCVVWWNNTIFKAIANDVLQDAIKRTELILRAGRG